MTVATIPVITMAVESIIDCWDESQAMWLRHWQEMPHEGETFDPDKDLYAAGHACGVFRYYTLRDNGTLIGYACFAVFKSFWHKGQIEAGGHSLYLEPEYRKGWTGVKFLRWVIARLKDEGVKRIKMHSHLDRSEGRLFSLIRFRGKRFKDVHIEHEMEL